MFKELLSVFQSDTLMNKAFDRSFEMLELTRQMFHHSKEILRNTDERLSDIDIYKEDHAVNKYEREVRKHVFNHLLLTGSEQLPSGLALVSIVIDIERIGDFTKNIVEIASEHGSKLTFGEYEETLIELETAVETYFEKTIKCFKNSDENLGLTLLNEYGWVSKKCDELIRGLLRREDEMKTGSAVALTLYIRSLKRIYSHLKNINTSVVNPFHRIGFNPKKK